MAQVVTAAGLDGLEDRKFGELSGGQQRRVLFGIALAGDPDLLMFDEPTTGLDVEARRGLWATLRELARSGRGVVLTTHYLEEADALADRIVVIDRGVVIAQGTPAEIKARVPGRRVRAQTSVSLAVASQWPGVAQCITRGSVARAARRIRRARTARAARPGPLCHGGDRHRTKPRGGLPRPDQRHGGSSMTTPTAMRTTTDAGHASIESGEDLRHRGPTRVPQAHPHPDLRREHDRPAGDVLPALRVAFAGDEAGGVGGPPTCWRPTAPSGSSVRPCSASASRSPSNAGRAGCASSASRRCRRRPTSWRRS